MAWSGTAPCVSMRWVPAASNRPRRPNEDMAIMTCLLGEAMRGGALGFSTSRTYLHKVPDGRPVPGTYAEPEELFVFADVLGRHGAGVFESASRIGEGERDNADIPRNPRRAGLDGRGQPAQRTAGQLRTAATRQPPRPVCAGDRTGQARELPRSQRAPANHGAQRRGAVQPRHAQPVRPRRLLARAADDAQRQEAGGPARPGDAHSA